MNPNSNHYHVQPTAVMTKRSTFNRPKSHLFTGNVGDLIPFTCDEILPGDTVTIDTSKVVRLQTLLAPIFDEMFLDTYYFFVPQRLVWDHSAEFFGENNISFWEQPTEYELPVVSFPNTSTGWLAGSVADYLGLPINVVPKDADGNNLCVNALPFRAYCKIWNDWFRDENTQEPLYFSTRDTLETGDNRNPALGGAPAKANKIHDRFTSCLPAPQKAADVPIGFGEVIPVELFNEKLINSPYDVDNRSKHVHLSGLDGTTHELVDVDNKYILQTYQSEIARQTTASTATTSTSSVIPDNMGITLDNASYSINTLRTAFAVQRYYEKLARAGSRYTEWVKSMFSVTSPDARLQRSEYLGGSRMTLDVNQVQATAATSNESKLTRLGDLGANSVTGEFHSDFTKSFTEHGFLLGLCVVRYKHRYQQGIEKMWMRRKALDLYNPTFANIGEQPVYTQEIFAMADAGRVFGYNEAWSEYRVARDYVSGEFNSAYQTPLDSWHLADNYSRVPTLSSAWMQEDQSNVDRVLSVSSTNANQLLFDYFINAKWTRVMPLYSVPGLIDHM